MDAADVSTAERNMLDLDPPDHTRLRSLVHKAFTPSLVEQMRSRTQAISDELLDRVLWLGEMDLISDFALPLPMTIITEILGVPANDHDKFHRWSKAVVSLTSPSPTLRVIPRVWKFLRYLRHFFKLRRRDPKDDLVSALIKAEDAGDKLSEDELAGNGISVVDCWTQTTVNLIGNGILALIENPNEMRKLQDEPSLVKPAVEELLRFTSLC